jgi:hypothetical protein
MELIGNLRRRILLGGKQDEKSTSIRMRDRRGPVRGRVFWRSRSADSKRVLHPMRNRSLPGRHITDCQMRSYGAGGKGSTPLPLDTTDG